MGITLGSEKNTVGDTHKHTRITINALIILSFITLCRTNIDYRELYRLCLIGYLNNIANRTFINRFNSTQNNVLLHDCYG